jgi:hypothetical protein
VSKYYGDGHLLRRKSGVVYLHPNLLPQKTKNSTDIYTILLKFLLDAKSKLSLPGVRSFDSQPKNTTDIVQEIKHFPAIRNQDTAGWCYQKNFLATKPGIINKFLSSILHRRDDLLCICDQTYHTFPVLLLDHTHPIQIAKNKVDAKLLP